MKFKREQKSKRLIDKRCSNCLYPVDGMCSYCHGENFGHETEISSFGTCDNWREKK